MIDRNNDSQPGEQPSSHQHDDRDFKLPPPGGTRKRNANPPPPKKSSPWALIIILTVVIGGAGLFLLVILGATLAAAGVSGGIMPDTYRETVIRNGEGNKKVVVIPIHGVLLNAPNTPFGGGIANTDDIVKQLHKVAKDKDVAAVILDINSPGGEITATDEIHREIQKLRKEKKIRVITCMRSVAASGGYYLAAGTDYIVANRLTLTGSVGVIMGGLNYSELFDKVGLKSAPYKSGQMKDMGSPSRHALTDIAERRLELNRRRENVTGSPEIQAMERKLIDRKLAEVDIEEQTRRKEKALIQAMVDKCFEEFAKVVSEGRKLPIEKVKAPPIGDARVMSGVEAQKLGLVDQLGYFDDAVANALGKNKYRVVRYDAPPSLFEALGVTHTGESPLAKLIPPEMNFIKKGRMYYLNPSLF